MIPLRIVETFDATVDAKIAALPADMRARFVRITGLSEGAGGFGRARALPMTAQQTR